MDKIFWKRLESKKEAWEEKKIQHNRKRLWSSKEFRIKRKIIKGIFFRTRINFRDWGLFTLVPSDYYYKFQGDWLSLAVIGKTQEIMLIIREHLTNPVIYTRKTFNKSFNATIYSKKLFASTPMPRNYRTCNIMSRNKLPW